MGLTPTDAARALGVSPNALRVRLFVGTNDSDAFRELWITARGASLP
jgi:hypothetical protein